MVAIGGPFQAPIPQLQTIGKSHKVAKRLKWL